MLEHICEVCGKPWRKKLIADGKVVCNKHYKQFRKFGCFRDISSRTQRDKNNITIDGNIAYIDLYDKFYNVIARAIIDADDIDKVKYIKWRLNGNGYVINNSSTTMFLHRRILNCNTIVDHINGNRLDNRKCNLRVVTKSQNQMNVDYKGVYLINNQKCKDTEFRYGTITSKYVIYRGKSKIDGEVKYLNVEEYLNGLGKDR